MAIIDFYEIGSNQIYNNKFTGYAYLHFDTETYFYHYIESKKGIDGDIKKGTEYYSHFTTGLISGEATGLLKTTLYYWRICIRVGEVTSYTDWNLATTKTYMVYVFLPTDYTYHLQTLRATSDDYATAHNAASGSMIESDQIGQQKWGTEYRIYRSPGLWDTTGIISEGVASAALCGEHLGALIADFKIVVQSGQPTFPHSPVIGVDYDKANYGDIGGESETLVAGKGGYSFNTPFEEEALSWIQNGLTKLMLRSSKELAASPPVGSDEHINAWVTYLMVECLPPSVSIISFENSTEYTSRYKITGNVTAHGGKALIGAGYAYSMTDPENGGVPANPSYDANTELGEYEKDNIYLSYRGWKYYIWACAYNGQYSYSPDYIAFWTPVLVQTYDPPYSVTYDSAYLRGKLTNSQATILSMGFEYYEEEKPEDINTVYYTPIKSTGDFWKTYKVFNPLTKYFYRAFAEDSWGRQHGVWVEFTTLEPPAAVINVKAERDSTQTSIKLYGKITSIYGATKIIEKGFEYLVQDEEPAPEATGIEVIKKKPAWIEFWEIGEYWAYEYEGNDVDFWDRLYNLEENTIWWFRAYCKDNGANKYVAISWMKNLPNVITQDMTNINYNKADGNGLIVSEGASELTMRGFEVIHEFSGRLPDSWRFEIGGFEGEVEAKTTVNDIGVITDFYWAGTLIKTVFETYALAVGAYSMTIGSMLFGWPIMQDCLVEGKNYTCKAFAENEFGRAYGEEIDFSTWTRTYFSENPPTTGELTIVKNEIIENLPVGITASRRGFRYGTTETADEFDVHENGSFTNGPYSMMLSDLLPDTTYYIVAYIVVQGIVYEGEMEIITTDPEGTEDEDEYPTPHYSPQGQDYREMETKVFAEVLASQGIIDFSGGKKTLSIINHLIQTNPEAKTIADNYLNRFKLAKTRMSVSYPTPLPFEREDTINFSYGALLFKNDDEGITHFKEDGEGMSVLMDQITMIIKQINSVGLVKTPDSIEYVADLDLEHG